jgi:hypothetical protein
MRTRVESTAAEAQRKVEQAHQADDATRALLLPRTGTPAPAPDSTPPKGYNDDQRRDLNRLFQQNTQ